MSSLAEGLFTHGAIITTEARAKELRPYAEKLITIARKGTISSRRILVSRLGTAKRASKLFLDIAPKYKDKTGGYTRIIKLPVRKSDASKMARIELL